MSSGERKGGKKRNGGENPTEGGDSPVNTIRIEKWARYGPAIWGEIVEKEDRDPYL